MDKSELVILTWKNYLKDHDKMQTTKFTIEVLSSLIKRDYKIEKQVYKEVSINAYFKSKLTLIE